MNVNFEIGLDVLNSYKRLAYKEWYAIAEFVDNSTQAYLNPANRRLLDEALQGLPLEVRVFYSPEHKTLSVCDNSMGMDLNDLESALKVGVPPNDTSGRSRYGLGMKTSAFWFGDQWSITTTKLGNSKEYTVKLDIASLVRGGSKIEVTEIVVDESSHYTNIKINTSNRAFAGRTKSTVKEYLCSFYRYDFEKYGLKLFWQDQLLRFDRSLFEIFKDPLTGEVIKTEFHFLVGTKEVHGWIGMLANPARKEAGLNIIQNERVIMGWPNAYRPQGIFGEGGGRNDLINQRVTGEIFFDNFEVSHTKDLILFEDDEEYIFEEELKKAGDHVLQRSRTIKKDDKSADELITFASNALRAVKSELQSNEFNATFLIKTAEALPNPRAIGISFSQYVENSAHSLNNKLSISIGEAPDRLLINVFFKNASIFDPYSIVETSFEGAYANVVINLLHPFWTSLKTEDSITHFIRESVYDAVSEFQLKRRYPNQDTSIGYTIRYIKDQFLRVPYEINSNKVTV